MTAVGIGKQFVEKVARLRVTVMEVPQVMVWIANRQFGFEGFFCDLCQPGVVVRHVRCFP